MTSEEQRVHLTIPAKPEFVGLCRLALAGLFRGRPIPDETLADLKLALTEACSNVVRHAYRGGPPGHVEILYRLQDDRLVVEVMDEGEGFELREPARDGREFDESGLGLAIIRSLTDDVEVHDREDARGAKLRFTKHLGQT